MIGRTNAKGLSDQSWANYVAVRNRTKTTIEAGDIDLRTLTGAYSGNSIFEGCASLTSAVINASTLTGVYSGLKMFYGCTSLSKIEIDLRTINGVRCLDTAFAFCTSLTSLKINVAELKVTNTMSSTFINVPLNTLIIDDMADSTIWSTTLAGSNILVAIPPTLFTNLTFNCIIKPNIYAATIVNISLASVVQVLGQLFDYSAGVAHTITFNRAFTGLSTSDYALIDTAKTTAVARNWTVAGLTYSM